VVCIISKTNNSLYNLNQNKENKLKDFFSFFPQIAQPYGIGLRKPETPEAPWGDNLLSNHFLLLLFFCVAFDPGDPLQLRSTIFR
jgi:hypothetical protein